MDTVLPPPRTVVPIPRHALVAAGVLALHVAALWALQSGLLRRAVEVVVPVEILSSFVTPPTPRIAAPPPPPAPPVEAPKPVLRKLPPTAPPAPRPIAVPDAPVAPNVPLGATEVQPAPAGSRSR